MDPDHRGTLREEWLDLGGELLRQIVELRPEPGLHALAGPDQLLAEGAQPRALAAVGLDQRHAEEIRPLLDQIPDMAIGEMGVGGGAGDLAGFPDLAEQAEHHDDALRAAVLVKPP
jgi:hypothetical protein